jgi:hypothetical protein
MCDEVKQGAAADTLELLFLESCIRRQNKHCSIQNTKVPSFSGGVVGVLFLAGVRCVCRNPTPCVLVFKFRLNTSHSSEQRELLVAVKMHCSFCVVPLQVVMVRLRGSRKALPESQSLMQADCMTCVYK